MSYDFEKEYGFAPPRMVGKLMAVAIHKHIMTGTQSNSIELPDEVIENQKWATIVGRIVHKGSAAFKGDYFKDWEDIPELGDWIVFKTGQGPLLTYRGIDMIFMHDEMTRSIIEDPTYVTRD